MISPFGSVQYSPDHSSHFIGNKDTGKSGIICCRECQFMAFRMITFHPFGMSDKEAKERKKLPSFDNLGR
jgi:hypothetical protein